MCVCVCGQRGGGVGVRVQKRVSHVRVRPCLARTESRRDPHPQGAAAAAVTHLWEAHTLVDVVLQTSVRGKLLPAVAAGLLDSVHTVPCLDVVIDAAVEGGRRYFVVRAWKKGQHAVARKRARRRSAAALLIRKCLRCLCGCRSQVVAERTGRGAQGREKWATKHALSHTLPSLSLPRLVLARSPAAAFVPSLVFLAAALILK